MQPEVQAGLTLHRLNPLTAEDVDLGALIAALSEQTRRTVNQGDLGHLETMLVAQAHTLDALFNTLTRRALGNMGQYVNTVDLYMRLALRAQSQCRATAETLADIKNPSPVAFVRQANIAHGPQQVNNQVPCARENGRNQNELLKATDENRLDGHTPSPSSGFNSHLETMGALNRPPNDSGSPEVC